MSKIFNLIFCNKLLYIITLMLLIDYNFLNVYKTFYLSKSETYLQKVWKENKYIKKKLTYLSVPSRLHLSTLSNLASDQYNLCALWSRANALGILILVSIMEWTPKPLR